MRRFEDIQYLSSYFDLFGDDFSMYKRPGSETPKYKKTEYIVGNGLITARTGGEHPLNGGKNLTTLDCLYGNQKHPKSTYSLFAWPFVDGWSWGGEEGTIGRKVKKEPRTRALVPYRCSCFYYSIDKAKYMPLGIETPINVHVSYVLGTAVVKAVIEQKDCTFCLYTWALPETPVVCQYIMVKPKKNIRNFSLILYTNPVVPNGPVVTHQSGMSYEDATNNSVKYNGRGFMFRNINNSFFLNVVSNCQPSGYGCRNISKVKNLEKYYCSLSHLKYNENISKADGDVESIIEFSFDKMKFHQSVFFAYIVESSPEKARIFAKKITQSSPKELLDKTVRWWRNWLGYHEPCSKIEALIQQGLISIKVMQAATGGVSAGTTWRKCFARDSFHLMMPFLFPYGNCTAHRKDVNVLLKFHQKASEKFGYSTTGGYNFSEPDFSHGDDGKKIDISYIVMALREYLRQTGDFKTVQKYQKLAKKIAMYKLSEAGDVHLMYLHIDSAFRHDWAAHIGFGEPGRKIWPASFDDSLSLSYAIDLLETLARREENGTKAEKYKQIKESILKSIEDSLITNEGLYGVITPDGKLVGDITFRHLQHIYLGPVHESYWKSWLEKAKERMLVTLPLEGKRIECVITSPAVRSWKWGVEGYFILAALKAGDSALAKRVIKFLLKSASPHGTWAEGAGSWGKEGVFGTTAGSLNFCWNTGVNITGLFSYYIGLMPLEEGYDKPFQIWPHDLDKILPVGKSFGAGISLQIIRLNKETYELKLSFLKEYSTRKYTLEAEKAIFNGKKKIALSKKKIIKGIKIPNLNNTKIIFTPSK